MDGSPILAKDCDDCVTAGQSVGPAAAYRSLRSGPL